VEFFKQLTDDHIDFIGKQPIFFVATSAPEARINLSPKGMDSFRVFDPACVGYLDMGGSGNETHAHLAADGRITIMFCAFAQPALILRLYGRGRAILPQDSEWDRWVAPFDPLPGVRQIFVIDLDSIQTSCGWGVPIMTLERARTTLSKVHASGDPEERLAKLKDRTRSIDGLPIRAPTKVARFSKAE
jgi:hypothetical protein